MTRTTKPTMKTVAALYNAAMQSYNWSYALMSKDAFSGLKAKADKLGLDAYQDQRWVSDIIASVRAFTTWASLDAERKADILADLRDGR